MLCNRNSLFIIVLEELKGRSDAVEFIKFVSEKRAEDYYSVIDYPMCLNEVRDRINRHQCDSKTKVHYSSH